MGTSAWASPILMDEGTEKKEKSTFVLPKLRQVSLGQAKIGGKPRFFSDQAEIESDDEIRKEIGDKSFEEMRTKQEDEKKASLDNAIDYIKNDLEVTIRQLDNPKKILHNGL